MPSIGFTDLNQLDQIDPDKVAYNHEAYSVILKQLTSLQTKNPAEVKESGREVDRFIGEKLQAVLDNAPELTNNPEKRDGLNLAEKYNGDINAAAEEALSYFEDTKDLKKIDIKALGLSKNFEKYSVTTAKAVLAEYKLDAYRRAAVAKNVIKEDDAKKYTILLPEKKQKKINKPVNQFINTCKNALANFAKPQNLAKLGFRQVATKGLQRLVEHSAHLIEDASPSALAGEAFPIPCIGGIVGFAMKFGECCKKILKDKQKKQDVFRQAAPELARGLVNIVASLSPVAVAAGPIAAVASVAVKGIQKAHEEGFKIGKGFFKRALKEFTRKDNLINIGMSVAGMGIGLGARKLTEDVKEAGGIGAFWNKITGRDQSAQANEAEVLTNPEEVSSFTVNEDGELINNQELSYVEQYIHDHPGAHLDKNGWMQNADGSYARNELNQMFGDENRAFRALTENEQLDKFGNIVDKPTSTITGNEKIIESAHEVVHDKMPTLAKTDEVVKMVIPGTNTTIAVDKASPLAQGAGAVADNVKKFDFASAVKQRIQQNAAEESSEVVQNNIPNTVNESDYVNSQNGEVAKPDMSKAEMVVEPEQEVTQGTETVAEPEPSEPVYQDGLPVRSEEELAAIDALQERATRARQFNSLDEEQQRHLIEVKAKALVAEEQGNTERYNFYKEKFETEFKQFVKEDQELDRMSELANKGQGSTAYRERERDLAEVRAMASMNNPKEHEVAVERFEDKWGGNWGTNAKGVEQFVRQSGSLKMEVPDVPQKNFAELGYHKQDDGTWLYDDGITKNVVQDINGNGIPDAGDTYDKTIELGTPDSSFYSKNHSAGVYVESTKEQISELRNADKYLEYAIARERERLSGQDLQK